MITARTLNPGIATGEVIRLTAPLSFWGGTDENGRIIDAHHPQCGVVLAGRVLVMESGRGSSSASSVLAEQIRAHTAPAAIILARPDTIIALGALIAHELYDLTTPVVVVDGPLPASGRLRVDAGPAGATISPLMHEYGGCGEEECAGGEG
ncbi:aconitase X swivel domain-containing protein [Kribbella sp. NPDC050241]|uniref:aconitase X swivel domain-containing protein n=1 Tax=Kribbella sp. NPDC050241 TaxID=3364115 RepID=UPI0037A3C93D